MTHSAWITLVTVLTVLTVLVCTSLPVDLVLLSAVLVLVFGQVLTPDQCFAGFANPALLTVAVLFVVAAGLQRGGGLALLSKALLRTPRRPTLRRVLATMTIPIAMASAFLNNTPLVAMMLPPVRDWATRLGFAPSKLLIPLSYATILGGVTTLIGTSTNLVVAGLYHDAHLDAVCGPIGFATIAPLGIPIALLGLAIIIGLGPILLPHRGQGEAAFADPRTFVTEMLVEPGGPLVGQALSALRVDGHAITPIEIIRGDTPIPAPSGNLVLEAGDRLVLAAPSAAMIALHGLPGLKSTLDHRFGEPGRRARELVEVVVADSCPLVGDLVGDGSFRKRYGAAVLAVARGERVLGAGEPWRLRAGDVLLLEARAGFSQRHGGKADFWLVDRCAESVQPSGWQSWWSLGVLALMSALAASGLMPMLLAAVVASLLLVATRILSPSECRASLDLPVIITIACALALGQALDKSGLGATLASRMVALGGDNPQLVLIGVAIATSMITELITNNAAAAMMFPLAVAAAHNLQVSPMPFVMGIMVAASCSFATPIGYQTNLMVYGPGRYRFTDFLRLGLPLNLSVSLGTALLAPVIWPFR